MDVQDATVTTETPPAGGLDTDNGQATTTTTTQDDAFDDIQIDGGALPDDPPPPPPSPPPPPPIEAAPTDGATNVTEAAAAAANAEKQDEGATPPQAKNDDRPDTPPAAKSTGDDKAPVGNDDDDNKNKRPPTDAAAGEEPEAKKQRTEDVEMKDEKPTTVEENDADARDANVEGKEGAKPDNGEDAKKGDEKKAEKPKPKPRKPRQPRQPRKLSPREQQLAEVGKKILKVSPYVYINVPKKKVKEFGGRLGLCLESSRSSKEKGKPVYVKAIEPQSLGRDVGIKVNWIVVAINEFSVEGLDAPQVAHMLSSKCKKQSEKLLIKFRDPKIRGGGDEPSAIAGGRCLVELPKSELYRRGGRLGLSLKSEDDNGETVRLRVSHVAPKSLGAEFGVKAGWCLECINEINTERVSCPPVSEIISAALHSETDTRPVIYMRFRREDLLGPGRPLQEEQLPMPLPNPEKDESKVPTSAVKLVEELVVSIPKSELKEGRKLGLQLESESGVSEFVFVKAVMPESIAGGIGIQQGWHLLAVNGFSTRNKDAPDVARLIGDAVGRQVDDEIELRFRKSNPVKTQEEEGRNVEIVITRDEIKAAEGKLGFKLADLPVQNKTLVYVKSVKKKTLAYDLGIRVDWFVTSIDGKPLVDGMASSRQLAKTISTLCSDETSTDDITMTFHAFSSSEIELPRKKSPSRAARVTSGKSRRSETAQNGDILVSISMEEMLKRGGQLGMLLESYLGTRLERARVCVKAIKPNSVSAAVGIQKGWFVLGINGKSTERMDAPQVAKLLAAATQESQEFLGIKFRDPIVGPVGNSVYGRLEDNVAGMNVAVTKQEVLNHDGNFGMVLGDIEFQGSWVVFVKTVEPNSIASNNGIEEDWFVTSVNGKSTDGMNAKTVTELLADSATTNDDDDDDDDDDKIQIQFKDPEVLREEAAATSRRVSFAVPTRNNRNDGPLDSVLSMVSSILTIMDMYANNEQLQNKFLTALFALAECHDDNGVLIANTVLSEMKANPANAPVQASYCALLEALAKDIVAVRGTIVDNGGITSILDFMRQENADDSNVQATCLGAIRWLAVDNEQHVTLIAKAGGISDVLTAMRRFQNHAILQDNGCRVLLNLTCKNADNKIVLRDEGGIEAIIAALNNHQGNANIQKNGCFVLYQLSNRREIKELISQAGGVQAIETAIKYHPDLKWIGRSLLNRL